MDDYAEELIRFAKVDASGYEAVDSEGMSALCTINPRKKRAYKFKGGTPK